MHDLVPMLLQPMRTAAVIMEDVLKRIDIVGQAGQLFGLCWLGA